jgi:hypothetical protein
MLMGTAEYADAQPTEVMLRDASCYPDAACTAGQLQMGCWMGMNYSVYNQSAFRFIVSDPTVIRRFRGVGDSANQPNDPPWANLIWQLHIWDTEASFAAHPTAGNVVSRLLLQATHSHFGSDFCVEATVPERGLLLPAGSYWVSVCPKGNGNGGTQWFWRQTSTDLGSDVFATHAAPGEYFVYTDDFAYDPGSQAVDVFGYEITCIGDFNFDGVIDLSDLGTLLAVYEVPCD